MAASLDLVNADGRPGCEELASPGKGTLQNSV